MPLLQRLRNVPLPVYLYAAATFLSAFLLFSIQPLLAKLLLPWFGGAATVWATSLVFFTSFLCIGYLYTYFLTSLPGRTQARVHLMVIAGVLVITGASAYFGYPGLGYLLDAGTDASTAPWRVLGALAVLIGVPFVLLASTAPLLQYWYASDMPHSRYRLYALSNTGSLFSLLGFPFIFEPLLPIDTARQIWGGLFVGYAILGAIIARMVLRGGNHVEARPASASVGTWMWVRWLLFSSLPTILLVSETTVLTQSLTSVPLLWVLPLALYLVTFILAFGGRGRSILLPFWVIVATLFVYMHTPGDPLGVVDQTLSYVAFLFLGALFCHTQLYNLRPTIEGLPMYYVCIALGGAIGTFFGSLVAPTLFTSFFWEFPLTVVAVASIAAIMLHEDVFPRFMTHAQISRMRVFFVCLVCALFITRMVDTIPDVASVQSRNFYGYAQVQFENDATILMHGTTMHGIQVHDKQWAHAPVSYYSATSGVGRAIAYAREMQGGKGLRVAVVGLGTGSLAAYCIPGDSFVFYEIDSRIHTIARSYFSYLSGCKGAEVRIGDGRRLLEKERDAGEWGSYDVVVIDAFSDDSIPTHLLTKEAIELYLSQSRWNSSILAIHTSSRYLSLAPILERIADELDIGINVIVDSGSEDSFSVSSQWVVLSRDVAALHSPAFQNAQPWTHSDNGAPLWTDNSTSIFSVVEL